MGPTGQFPDVTSARAPMGKSRHLVPPNDAIARDDEQARRSRLLLRGE
jgi:hypothetical protein